MDQNPNDPMKDNEVRDEQQEPSGSDNAGTPGYSDSEPPRYGDVPPSNPTPGMPPSPGATPPPPPGVTPGLPPGPPPSPSPSPMPPPPKKAPGTLTDPTPDERNWAMFAHLSALAAGFVLSFTTMPFLGFIGPMIIFLVKKDESPFVADQAKEALNFSISIGMILFVLWLLSFTIILMILTIPLIAIVSVTALVFIIIAAVKSNAGELYRYPFTLRLVK